MQVYVDTSVFGGMFDEEFSASSRAFFEEVRGGRFHATISAIVLNELQDAPEDVRQLYGQFEPVLHSAEVSESSLRLMRHYLAAGIVGEKWRADALHVAVATVSGCKAIVSWNFRHIVHFEKIPLYNGVNMTQGFGTVAIHTPQEMVHYEDKDV